MNVQPNTHGLTVQVARVDFGGIDCTAGGVSSRHDRLTVVGIADRETRKIIPLGDDARVFAASADAPAVALCIGAMPGIVVIYPAELNDAGDGYRLAPGWHCMGGNFAALGDSRLCRAAESVTKTRFYGAVAVHDRREW